MIIYFFKGGYKGKGEEVQNTELLRIHNKTSTARKQQTEITNPTK